MYQSWPVKRATHWPQASPLPQHEEPVLGEHRQERGERVVEQVKDEERAAGNSFR
jgi:hypothetical protein